MSSRPAAAATTRRPRARRSRRACSSAVPFTPTYAEYIYLKGAARARRPDGISARALPAHQPAARTHPAFHAVNHAAPPAVHLIDASYFVFRAYYSVGLEMTDGDGQLVNALYGFGRFRRPARRSEAGACRGRVRRKPVELVPECDLSAYKANREPAPPELKRQFALCRELCRLLGLAEFGSPTHEADDIIGTIAARLRDPAIAPSS